MIKNRDAKLKCASIYYFQEYGMRNDSLVNPYGFNFGKSYTKSNIDSSKTHYMIDGEIKRENY